MQHSFTEAARETPVVSRCDVLVAGAGPAGVAAALAAARQGAETVLIETHGCLGGVWTAGALAWILDHKNKAGVLAELIADLRGRGAGQPSHFGGAAFDVEAMKLLLEEKCLAAGVRVRLHTRVVAAGRDTDNRLAVAVTESKSGREAWAAKVFIDATGDGDLAARAGCGFDMGKPGTGETQPLSLLAILAGLPDDAGLPYVHVEPNPWRSDTNRLLERLASVGVTPSYGAPVLFRLRTGEDGAPLYAMMANHEYGVKATNAQAISDATVRARAEVNRIVDGLRRSGPPFQNLRLVATGAQIGVREGRRIHGRYRVSAQDLIDGARFEDAVCRVTFKVDVHSVNPKTEGTAYGNQGVKAQPYDVPLRALIARDVDGLLLAGRCISGDFFAHASYRVTGNACALGEAAGLCAAVAARTDRLPHEVPFAEIKPLLPELPTD